RLIFPQLLFNGGMKSLPRDVAFGKLRALAEAAALVRRGLP
ncbi:MAG: hypothetical protein JWQ36_802, partial [Enterovirga sp.]|nr:hypothetical protein [Enterovirga sp.]